MHGLVVADGELGVQSRSPNNDQCYSMVVDLLEL